MHISHPSLYEINTRVLLRSLKKGATIRDIPLSYWHSLKDKGIDWIWLMGIWQIREKALDPHLIGEGMMHDFRELLPDLISDDICGSPYAIHDYVIDPELGTEESLRTLKNTLHDLGMRLMLDFVPNHFGAHTKYLDSHPQYFVEGDELTFLGDHSTFYRPWPRQNRFFAHGKDPYFDAWQDTVQVNYANPDTHTWMRSLLERISELCDGVRCDMAMLPVSRIFRQTWKGKIAADVELPEFWPQTVTQIKSLHPEFLFLAECYWDMEAELMEMGFDYCYDKVFFDRLADENGNRMQLHFHAEPWWLLKTARFLENHDEPRSASRLHFQKHFAAAALVALGPGMRFWHMGQWEGWRKKVPVQLARAPYEPPCGCITMHERMSHGCAAVRDAYDVLLQLNQQRIFREGQWTHLHRATESSRLIWLWQLGKAQALVVINLSDRETDFSLHQVTEELGVSQAKDLFSDNAEFNIYELRSLAPWGVYAWSIE